jgi:predicted glutamine amidotransferase
VIRAHLIDLPDSIKNLGYANGNGWSVGYYPDGVIDPEVSRGQSSAYGDPAFDTAAESAAAATPRIAVSHVRLCSSGLCAIPNPHPFEREKNGKHWLMGHNGTISKSVLIGLIDADYLAANPPLNGTSQSNWIDSELYFLLMLQTIEDNDWVVAPALQDVVRMVRNAGGAGNGINFFITDGTTLWAYREGYSLYYVYDDTGFPCSAVASSYPTGSQGDWVRLSDGQFITLHPDRAPEVVDL